MVQQSWVSEGMAEDTGTTFFLDGAHTPESMATCAEWFFEASHTQQDSGLPAGQPALTPHRILLFNCMKVITSCDSSSCCAACAAHTIATLGLPLGLEAPFMTPNGVFFLSLLPLGLYM